MDAQSDRVGPGETGWATRFSQVRVQRRSAVGSLRAGARHLALTAGGSLASFSDPSFLRCLYVHYVYDDQVEGFRRLLQRLQQVGTFISTERVVAMVKGEQPIDGRYFHLSFDDGFDNLHRNALPVMSELSVPSAVFIATRFVGAGDADIRDVWWVPAERKCPTRSLRWEQVSEMARLGHDIGAHTRHHRRISEISVDPGKLSEEVLGSKQDIEDKLGAPCRYFAWPWGRSPDIDERGLAFIEESGYEACFSAIRGSVRPGHTSGFSIPRHHFEPEWPWLHVRYFAAGGHEVG